MALLILRESNNTTRYTGKRPNPRLRPCFATPRSGHITTPRPNSSLARQWGNITMPHPGNTLARYPDSTQAPRLSNTLALHRVNPAPRQIHPVPHRVRNDPAPYQVQPPPVPHRAHNIPALSRGPSQEPSNKKSVRIATFLRLAIVASSPIANRGTKTQQKWHISSLKEPRRAPNRKKVAKIPSFLFFVMGSIAATGKIPRKRAEHHDQQPKIRNKKGARYADASRKTNSAEIYASLAPYCS